jgi:negative regulator of sigma E activity
MTEERDSQLSAMFDDELPVAECELLARRLSRDEALRAQWSRFAVMGAALRAERGVALHDRVAWRVQSVIAQEAAYGEGGATEGTRSSPANAAGPGSRRWLRFAYPIAGASVAAGVAAVSIFLLQGVPAPDANNLQASVSPTTIVLTPDPGSATVAMNTAPESAGAEPAGVAIYSTPAPSSATSIAPPARLANYVVAHSEYSGPLQRRMALLGIVGAEGGDAADETAPETATLSEDNDAR